MKDSHTEPNQKSEERVNIFFFSLVTSLGQAAMSQLGKIPNPASGKINRDIKQAQITIEMVAMLEEKTRGNLNLTEKRLLETLLTDLRLNFADEVKQEEAKKEAPEEKPAAPEKEEKV